MFGLIRISIISIRTFLNCLFFPFLSLVFIIVSKLVYDAYGHFYGHTWELPKLFFNWFFGKYKAWDLSFIENPNVVLYCKYGAFFVLFAICISNICGITNLLIKFLRSNSGVRTTLNREEFYRDRIIKICDKLEKQYESVFNKSPKKIKVKIIDSDIKNALIFSDNCIVLTTGLLERTDDDELEGVIAHEWGHMHNGDTLFNQLTFANGVVSHHIELGLIIKFILGIFSLVSRIPFVGWMLGLCAFVVFGPFLLICLIFGVISSFLAFFEAQISQRQEYLADQFVLSMGKEAGNGLLTFLYEEMRMQDNFKNLSSIGTMMKATLSSLYQSHPVSHKRIKRLEKILDKKSTSLGVENTDERKNNKWIK